jgi:hypothetical protein
VVRCGGAVVSLARMPSVARLPNISHKRKRRKIMTSKMRRMS